MFYGRPYIRNYNQPIEEMLIINRLLNSYNN